MHIRLFFSIATLLSFQFIIPASYALPDDVDEFLLRPHRSEKQQDQALQRRKIISAPILQTFCFLWLDKNSLQPVSSVKLKNDENEKIKKESRIVKSIWIPLGQAIQGGIQIIEPTITPTVIAICTGFGLLIKGNKTKENGGGGGESGSDGDDKDDDKDKKNKLVDQANQSRSRSYGIDEFGNQIDDQTPRAIYTKSDVDLHNSNKSLDFPNGKFESNPVNHGKTKGSNIQEEPINGQELFNEAIKWQTRDGFVNIEKNGKFVEFRPHADGVYHGKVIRNFQDLTEESQKALYAAGLVPDPNATQENEDDGDGDQDDQLSDLVNIKKNNNFKKPKKKSEENKGGNGGNKDPHDNKKAVVGAVADERKRKYVDVAYHHQNSKGGKFGGKSPSPKDGQKALDNSILFKKKGNQGLEKRLSVEEDKFIILQEGRPNEYHGHLESWNTLSDDVKHAYYRAGIVEDTATGKLVRSIAEKTVPVAENVAQKILAPAIVVSTPSEAISSTPEKVIFETSESESCAFGVLSVEKSTPERTVPVVQAASVVKKSAVEEGAALPRSVPEGVVSKNSTSVAKSSVPEKAVIEKTESRQAVFGTLPIQKSTIEKVAPVSQAVSAVKKATREENFSSESTTSESFTSVVKNSVSEKVSSEKSESRSEKNTVSEKSTSQRATSERSSSEKSSSIKSVSGAKRTGRLL